MVIDVLYQDQTKSEILTLDYVFVDSLLYAQALMPLNNRRSTMEVKPQWGRAIVHASIGILIIVFGQILPLSDDEKITIALVVGGTLSFLDLGVRLPLYYWVVIREWHPRGFWSVVRRGFLWLERHLLIKTKVMRAHERGIPMTAVHFTLGVIIPLLCGIPVWAVVPAVAIFAFGDPAAREVGLRYGVSLVKAGSTKTWEGFLAFTAAGLIGVIATLILHRQFPLYPHDIANEMLALALIMGVALQGLVELVCVKNGRILSHIFDDNFVVPAVGSFTIYIIATL